MHTFIYKIYIKVIFLPFLPLKYLMNSGFSIFRDHKKWKNTLAYSCMIPFLIFNFFRIFIFCFQHFMFLWKLFLDKYILFISKIENQQNKSSIYKKKTPQHRNSSKCTETPSVCIYGGHPYKYRGVSRWREPPPHINNTRRTLGACFLAQPVYGDRCKTSAVKYTHIIVIY